MESTTTIPRPGQVLAFGIVGLATSGTVVIGLIFSILALVKAGRFRNDSPEPSGQVNVGRGLGIAGIILSVMMLCGWVAFAIIAAQHGVYKGNLYV